MKKDLIELYSEVESMAVIGWWSLNLTTEELTWSPMTYKIHEVKEGTVVDKETAVQFYLPEYRDKIKSLVSECAVKGTPFAKNLQIRLKDGSIKWVRTQGRAHIENEIITSVIGTFQDITFLMKSRDNRRKLMEQIIEQGNLINSMAIVAETDRAGRITYVNELFEDISQYTRGELIGKTHSLVNSGHHSKIFFQEMWEEILKGHSWRGQICNRKKDGTIYWVETFIQPKIDNLGSVVGFVSFRYDITRQKELEAEMKAHIESQAMVSHMASIGEFAGSIAHEISNPLAVIEGNNGRLKRLSKDNSELVKIVQSIDKATTRMSNIISGMKSLLFRSKQEHYSLAHVNQIVKEVGEFGNEFLQNKGIRLELDLDQNDAIIECMDVQISQVLINLVKNARDAILSEDLSERKGQSWIKIQVSSTVDHVFIRVSDSGPGIAKEIAGQIMQTYFTTKEKGKGTGLGLSLVKRIVESHQGLIELEEFKPAVFFISLPRKQNLNKAA